MIGDKLGKRYELLEKIGGGGMAIVYKAKDNLLNRIVAVKILRSEFASDDEFVSRFKREAQAAASLSHQNIVNIYDIGVQEDIHYIVMEYVKGYTLKEIITERAPLKAEEAIHITKQIAEALDHAHQNNIIHRDIKPHNILISPNQSAKVTDFGIARAVTSTTITHTGSVIGSVHYFSPEQAKGGMTGEKSDIYSLGVVLYEMVTGELPFSGDSPISVALKHLQEDFPDPRNMNPDIPQSVENIIIRSLAKDTGQRYDSARDLITDMNTCLDPARLWEPKVELTNSYADDEQTKIIPAINENMLDTKIRKHPQSDETAGDFNRKNRDTGRMTGKDSPNDPESDREHDGEHIEDEDQAPDPEQGSKRKRPWWKKLLWAVIIVVALGIGGSLAFAFLSTFLYVQEVEVPEVIGLSLEEAIGELEARGLEVGDPTNEQHSSDVEEGIVLRQDPAGERSVKEGSPVQLTVSAGPKEVGMPSVIGLSESNAMRQLTRTGIPEENITIEEAHSSDIPNGRVLEQIPSARDEIVPSSTEVTLVLSMGAGEFDMPDLTGLSESEAEAELERYNLVLDSVQYEHHDSPEGKVFRQFPVEAGQSVSPGTPIRLWISQGQATEGVSEGGTNGPNGQNNDQNDHQNGSGNDIDEDTNDGDNPDGEEQSASVHTRTVEITVEPVERDRGGKQTDVLIVLTDVDGEQEVIKEKIREPERYEIEVRFSREQHATIDVYRDDQLYEQREVRLTES